MTGNQLIMSCCRSFNFLTEQGLTPCQVCSMWRCPFPWLQPLMGCILKCPWERADFTTFVVLTASVDRDFSSVSQSCICTYWNSAACSIPEECADYAKFTAFLWPKASKYIDALTQLFLSDFSGLELPDALIIFG